MTDTTQRFAVIGSSHLYGIIHSYVGPLRDLREKYSVAWETGVPATGRLDFGGLPGWEGCFVAYNTPAAGAPPVVRDQVLYMPPELSRVLGSIPQDTDCIFSLMRGHEFAMSGLVDDPSHADFNDGDSLCEAGRQWVSLEDATAWVREIAAPLFGTHLALKQHFPKARIVHVPAPPPIESQAHIEANVESFGPLFARHGIKPYAMRQRLYKLMYGTLNRDLAAYGIESLPVPSEALTPAGGLRADWARGCLHGNEHYGAALGQQMKRRLQHAPV
ncbi:MAG TPA: hypothetical protein VFL64_20000 [Rhizobacter sp.]|nr:hypothetical protein [Rhizobacter sp.]